MTAAPSQDPNQFQWPTLPQGGLRIPGQQDGAQPSPPPTWRAEPQPQPSPYAAAPHTANPYGETPLADPLAGTSTQWKQPPAQTAEVYNPPIVAPGPARRASAGRTDRERLAARVQSVGWIAAIVLMLSADGGSGFWWILLAIFVLPIVANRIRNGGTGH